MQNTNNTNFVNKTFEDLELDLTVVKSLISEGPKGLLNTQNAVDFLTFNYTRNLYSSYLKFNIQTLDQLYFLSDYFVNFLPNLILYPSFKFEENTKNFKGEKNAAKIYYGNKQSNALVSLIPIVFNNNIQKITKNMEQVLIANVAFYKLKSEQNLICCNAIFKNVTKNNKERVNEICGNHLINLDNYDSIKRWVYISDCIFSYCKENEKNEIKEISGLSEVNKILIRKISIFQLIKKL